MNQIESLYDQESKTMKLLKTLGIAFLGSLLIALSKPFTFFFPFTVIPITLQGSVVLIVAYLLGKERGTLAVAMFLLQGIMGLPVIGSGAVGLSVLLGPTAGYLLAYLLAAPLMGILKQETSLTAFPILLIGNATYFIFGPMYLSTFVGYSNAFFYGVVPFVATDFLKLLIFNVLFSAHSSSKGRSWR